MTASYPVIAHKFGGSSMRDAERIAAVADILLARRDERQLIVVSAMQGVTDGLIALVQAASAREPDWRERLDALAGRHLEAARQLAGAAQAPLCAWLQAGFADVADLLHALSLMGSISPEAMDLVQGMGEVWSSRLLAEHLRARAVAVDWLDAREVLQVRRKNWG